MRRGQEYRACGVLLRSSQSDCRTGAGVYLFEWGVWADYLWWCVLGYGSVARDLILLAGPLMPVKPFRCLQYDSINKSGRLSLLKRIHNFAIYNFSTKLYQPRSKQKFIVTVISTSEVNLIPIIPIILYNQPYLSQTLAYKA